MIVALDGMGVLYSAQDDVLELLCPFILEKGGIRDTGVIERIYVSASLGEITAAEFWRAVKLDPEVEDDYLSRHSLNPGLMEFMGNMKSYNITLWGLSNDISEWSHKLRMKFGLERYFQGFIVSGDVHCRKPDSLIYRTMLKQARARAPEIIFVDDRIKNLEPAAALGFRTILFDSGGAADPHNPHFTVNSFPSLMDRIVSLSANLNSEG
jgi:HAD superfamily hydrolase (TIGR01509 family)